MAFQFHGIDMIPGQNVADRITQEQQIWWGPWEQQLILSGVIEKDTTDTGNTGFTDILRPGLALGKITASGKLDVWNPYATNGTNKLFGFWMGHILMDFYGTTQDRLVGQILGKGNVYPSRLLIDGAASTYGISGHAYEFLLRQQMENRYFCDDDTNSLMNWKVYEIGTTASVTLTTADNRTWVTNVGDTDGATLVLPAPVPGLEFRYTAIVDTDIVIDVGGAGSEFLIGGSSADDDTSIGSNFDTIEIRSVRTAVTPTYQYILTPVPAAT